MADRIYIADGGAGLVVLSALADVQLTVRVDAIPGIPFTVQIANDLSAPIDWAPRLTTNVAVMPFDFVDFDVRRTEWPQKYYRVLQP